MYLLALSILFAGLEFSAIKIFKKLNINIVYSIIYSYPIALLCSILFFRPNFTSNQDVLNMLPVLLPLGLFMLIVFIFIVLSVEKSGIIVSIVAQRLSLVIPVLYSVLIFKEKLSYLSLTGILIAFIAIFLVMPFNGNNDVKQKSWLYPIGIFLGMGVIDILYGHIAKNQSISFDKALTITFLVATISGPFIVKIFRKPASFEFKTVVSGFILGIINFGAIYFFTSALKYFHNTMAIVFVIQAIGVISLGLILGTIIFGEKITAKKLVGILLAVIAIIILDVYK